MQKKAAFYFSILSLALPIAAFGGECLNLENEVRDLRTDPTLKSRQTTTDIRGLDADSTPAPLRAAIVSRMLSAYTTEEHLLVTDNYLPVTQDGCKSVTFTIKHERRDDAGVQIYYEQLTLQILPGSNAKDLIVGDAAYPDASMTFTRLAADRIRVITKQRSTWSFECGEGATKKSLTASVEVENVSVFGKNPEAAPVSEHLVKLKKEAELEAAKGIGACRLVEFAQVENAAELEHQPESVTQ